MKSRISSEQDVIERLQRLPLKEVPADLTDLVMARVSRQKASLISTVWNFISQTRSISFRPIYAFGTALLVCGAFLLGSDLQQLPVRVVASSTGGIPIKPMEMDNPESAYLVGRGLLQENNSEEQALAFLQRASLLDPENPEFAYWEGVGYWANGDKDKERLSYLRGLDVDSESVPLLINLGHSYLDDKHYQEALDAYRAVLALSPNEPVAHYNSGLIYRVLGMIPEEITSWRTFLQDNRVGAKSFRAVKRLHGYDDFAFRTYLVGSRKIIVNQQTLLDESLPEDMRRTELAVISAIIERNEHLSLEVVAFVENDLEAARKRALEIKSMILKNSKTDVENRVKLSWLDTPETMKREGADGGVELSESLLLTSRQINENDKEVSI